MSDVKPQRASGLCKLSATPRPVQVIAVTGGKGGIGKTNVSVNLAVAMAQDGRRVMLLDADYGLANVDVLLGMHPVNNLSHVVRGELSLNEIIVEGPAGVKIIPAASGLQEMAELSASQHAGIINAFNDLHGHIDTMIIDTAAGISANVTSYSRAAQEVLVVLCDEPAAITDAYALIKLLHKDYGVSRFQVLANMVNSAMDGRALFNKLQRVADKYLDVTLSLIGTIPQDEFLRKAVQKQKAVIEAFPRSKSALAFGKIAEKITQWPMPSMAQGHLEFFIERLIFASQETRGI